MELYDLSIENNDLRLVRGWANVDVKDVQGDAIPIEVMWDSMLDFIDVINGTIMFKHLNRPVGKILQWEAKMNEKAGKPGIQMVVKFFDRYKFHHIIWDAVKKGILKGFSIGADVPDPKINIIEQDGKKIPKKVNMNEISTVFDPANPYATIDEIASMAKSKECNYDTELMKFVSAFNKSLSAENIQEPPTDVRRLENLYGSDSAKKLLEIIGMEDAVKLLPREGEVNGQEEKEASKTKANEGEWEGKEMPEEINEKILSVKLQAMGKDSELVETYKKLEKQFNLPPSSPEPPSPEELLIMKEELYKLKILEKKNKIFDQILKEMDQDESTGSPNR